MYISEVGMLLFVNKKHWFKTIFLFTSTLIPITNNILHQINWKIQTCFLAHEEWCNEKGNDETVRAFDRNCSIALILVQTSKVR